MCKNGPLPLTLALASNTAYSATAHTRDISYCYCYYLQAGVEHSAQQGVVNLLDDLRPRLLSIMFSDQ